MVRKKTDPFWVYVEERPNERWMCKFCGSEYSGRASRIKAHFGQVKNRGIEVCHAVHPSVKAQALSALRLECAEGGQTSLRKSLVKETTQNVDKGIEAENFENFWSDFHLLQDPSVYNEYMSREDPLVVMTSPLSAEFQDGETDLATSQMQFQSDVSLPNWDITNVHQTSPQEDMAAGAAGETSIENFLSHNLHQSGVNMLRHNGTRSNDEKLYSLKRNIKELKSQAEEKEEELCHFKKKVKAIENVYKSIKGDQRHGKVSSFQQVNQVQELMAEVEELKYPGAKRLSRSVRNTKGAPLLNTELIGRESEISEIWNYIIMSDILRVGVYGMGGVGKTEIMMQIYNMLLECEAFDNVYWATMPRDFTIYELQDVIGNAVHLDKLSNEKNEKIRASMLHTFLTIKRKSVLILDGLWRHFNFNNVGIPMKFYGLKLVITSRSLDVCRLMLCQAKIKIQCLSDWKDQRSIFLDKLGLGMVLSTQVEEVAEQMVSTYGGLPLYIDTIATKMRGVENMHEWKDMMEKMKDPNTRFKELKNEVIDPLKLSYEFLADEQLQQCFIYCAFYIGSRKSIIQKEMIEFLIDVGLVGGMDNRQKLYDKANTILDKLENACLLERVNSTKGGSETVMKMHGAIIDMAVHCTSNVIPCMGTFGIGVKNIPSEKYLIDDLDENSYVMKGREETPNRSACCSELSILILHGESCLRMIPGLISSSLPELRILYLSETKIDKIPDYVGDLVNLTALVLRDCSALQHIPCIQKLRLLRKLDLYRCRSMRNIPDGLESLVNLEYLDLYGTCINKLPGRVVSNFSKLQYLRVNYIEAEGLAVLHKLETLYCCFATATELTRYLPSLTDKGPAEYLIFVGKLEFSFHQHVEMQVNRYSKAVVLNEPISMKAENYRDGILLPKNVEILLIYSCACKLIMFNSAPLENLEALEMHSSNFEVIFGDKYQGFQFPKSLIFPFPNIKRINMTSCPELKNLVALNLDKRFSLPVLEDINMLSCASTQPSGKHTESLSFLQNLKRIEILDSNIRILLTTEMFLNLRNLEEIDVRSCPHLEEIIMPASREMPFPGCAATHSSRLTSVCITECNMMERLLDHKLLIHLCELQTIDVSNCKRMEKITGTYNEYNNTVPVLTALPSLKTLRLMYLAQLTSIGTMKIDTPIEIIEVIRCPKIKRIPLYLSLRPDKLRAPHSLKKIYVSEQDWWDSLEWEFKEVKTLLQPYVEFKVLPQEQVSF